LPGNPYGPPALRKGGRVMGDTTMKRVIAVAACGFTLTACSSWMPSFDLPSMPSFGGGGAATGSLAVESDPPGAQASLQGGASCVTPCKLPVTASGPFNVNVALNGYVPQSVPVRIVQPDDPRLASADSGSGDVHLDPNPVYVELEKAAPPPPPPHKPKPKPRHPAVAKRAPPPAAAPAPAPAATPTDAAAPAAAAAPPPPPPPPAAAQQPAPGASAPWPMPR
jgi:hypothetical protein